MPAPGADPPRVQAGRVTPSDADLSGNGAGVIDFNAEVARGMRAIGGRIKADRGHPPADKSGLLPVADCL